MLDLFLDYALFTAKTATVAVAVLATVALVVATVLGSAAALSAKRRQGRSKGYLEVTRLNDVFDSHKAVLDEATLSPVAFKKYAKKRAKDQKHAMKERNTDQGDKKRLFHLSFKGDIRASAVESLRNEISSVLMSAGDGDEVLVSVESGGGGVSDYGFAASQLQRLLDKGLFLTVAIDRIAASGGYLMACVSNKVIAAPYALVGSIGVLAQVPNFHKLLQEHNIDMDVYTAGEFKLPVSMFGENTKAGKKKFQEMLEAIHGQFKNTIAGHRPHLDIGQVATGEVWLAEQAKSLGLVDELMTSDTYLMNACKEADVLKVEWVVRSSFPERFAHLVESGFKRAIAATKRNFQL